MVMLAMGSSASVGAPPPLHPERLRCEYFTDPRGIDIAHPCLSWERRATPCYLVGPRRIVLPAFSADARGVNVLGDGRWRSLRCGAIAGTDVLDFYLDGSRPDTLST